LHKRVLFPSYSVASTTSISHDEFRFCRICHESDGSTADLDFDAYGKLIAPCLCDGTLKYVHEKCVQRWMEVSRSKSCELCRFEYEVLTFTKGEVGRNKATLNLGSYLYSNQTVHLSIHQHLCFLFRKSSFLG
uniref:RING-CH-type domain-containing protein n=1 Tax=Hydatigena taeniaeformis TaxID=6205 RepID=A0A0R3X283_HYDTA